MSTIVRDTMTQRVVAVHEDAQFKEMAAILRWSRISAFPVIDQESRVVGVVSEADMLTKVADKISYPGWLDEFMHHRKHQKAAGVTAAELMTSPPVTIGPDKPVQAAARLMHDQRVKRLPVVDQAGHLIGIISRVDVLSVFGRADDDIRREVTDKVIRAGFLANPASLEVLVRDGIVTISGQPETDEAGRDIVAAARHVEGVVAVRDRLSYPGGRQATGTPAR